MEIGHFKGASLKRAIARLFRWFKHFCPRKEDLIKIFLITKELLHAKLQWVHLFQFRSLPAELKYLRGDNKQTLFAIGASTESLSGR